MLPAVRFAPVDDFPDVESVLEQMGERTNAETDTAPLAAIGTSIGLGLDAAPIEILDQRTIEPSSRYCVKMARTVSASCGRTTSFLSMHR